MGEHRRQRRLFLIAAVVAALCFVILAALVQARAGGGLDGKVLTWLEAHRRQPFTTIAIAFDRLGRWWLLGIAVAVLTGGLWWSRRMVQAVYLGTTVATSLTLNLILKIAFERQPPGLQPVVKASLYAFPSGHTMTATAIASALAVIAWPTRWRWLAVVLAALFALSMAVSRVYLGVHWPSDVSAGLALGFAVALGVRLLMPWPTPEEIAAVRDETRDATSGGTETPVPVTPARTAPPTEPGQSIDVVFLDWGNTLMVDNGMREGPMKDWKSVEVEPGAQEALRRLRARYRLVIATNAADSPALHVRLALARVGLDQLIDDVVSSADVGDRKPHYPFYRAALLRSGQAGVPLSPSRAVMVGDGTMNDVAGAQHAGLRTIWYNPTKRRFPQGATLPDATIRKLANLPDAVDRLAGVTPVRRSRRQRKADAAAAAAAEAAAIRGYDATTALRAETTAAHAAATTPETPPDVPADVVASSSAAAAEPPTDSTTGE